MAALMEIVPLVVENDNPTSMSELVEQTATGSLPMYLLFLAYKNSPYIVALFLLFSLVAFVIMYYRMMSPKQSAEGRPLLKQARV